LNILYLCSDRGIPIRGHKGAAVHVRALADAFIRAGHNVTIMAPRPGLAGGPAPLAELIHVPSREGELADGPEARERQALNYAETLYVAAREQLARHAFDFIYERYSLWSDVGGRLSHETGLPLVLEVNAPLLLEAARYRSLSDPEAAARIEAAQLKTASAVSVVSEELERYVLTRGARPENVHVLPNAVDPALFHPAVRGGAVRDQWRLKGKIVVGFAGRPRPWHDLETLFAAFARLRALDVRYHLLLVGEMPGDLPGRLEELGLSQAAALTGSVPHTAVPEFLAAMDAAVSPGTPLADFYFSPLKLFEYLACAVPTVAADIGQPAAIIRSGESGYLYPPGDAEALADRIRRLIADPYHAREVAWQGAAFVLEHHTWDINARTVTGWIEPPPPEFRTQNAECGMWNAAFHIPHSAFRIPFVLPILDHKLRQRLYRASRPDLAGPLLARRLPAFRKKGPERLISVEDVKVLKYKPGRRCVLAYELFGQAWRDHRPTYHTVIGKVYRDERGQRLLRLQQQLWSDGFGPDAPDRIHVPRPLAYVPEMRMLVQDCAGGETLNDLVTEVGVRTPIRRSAEGLAKLHNARLDGVRRLPSSGEVRHLGRQDSEPLGQYLLIDELASLERFTRELLEARPDCAREVLALRDALRAWARSLPPQEDGAAPIHRDFYYSQVLFDGPRLTLIDFDLLARGDPAIDVANFAAHLYFLGLDRLGYLDALADEASLFVEAYAGKRDVDEGFLERLAFYQAATFFRLMKVVATRPGLAHHFEALFRRTVQSFEAS